MAEIITLPSIAAPAGATKRSIDVIQAEMRGHIEAVRALALELAEASGCDPTTLDTGAGPDETLSLQRAAHAVGWSAQRLRRHMVRHNAAHPKDPIGYQPGGVSNAPWCIPMARLRRYVRDARE